MQLRELTKTIQDWVKPFFEPKVAEQTTHRCCLKLIPHELSMLHIDKSQAQVDVLLAETLSYKENDSIPMLLSGLALKHSIKNIPLRWLLQPDDYQLFLIEALPVPQDEFKDALNWRVRSLINYPIEEAALDYFYIPAKKVAPQNPMIAVVVTRKEKLQPMIDTLRGFEFNLASINIPEMALCNLAALYEEDEKSTAFICFYDKFAILNITLRKELYFTRRLNITSLNTIKDYETFSLEVMRYFDYFQSQWRHPAPSRLFFHSEGAHQPETIKFLTETLLLPVEKYQLKLPTLNKNKLELIEEKYLLAMGCALKDESNEPKY